MAERISRDRVSIQKEEYYLSSNCRSVYYGPAKVYVYPFRNGVFVFNKGRATVLPRIGDINEFVKSIETAPMSELNDEMPWNSKIVYGSSNIKEVLETAGDISAKRREKEVARQELAHFQSLLKVLQKNR